MNRLLTYFKKEPSTVENLEQALTDAGDDMVSVISAGAGVVSLIISAVAGLVLLVLCIMTAWKARQGNTDAWGDAMQTLATVAAVLCFSSAVSAIFF